MKTKLAQLWGLVYYLLLAGFDYGSRGIIFAEANTDRNLKHGEEISDTHRDHLKDALRKVEKVRMAKNNSCQSNESVILDIGFENARWKSEALLAVEVANLLTSLKRVKTADGFSMVENDTLLYNIVRSNVRFSPSVFGSVICFEKNQYRDYERFCPYAFRDKTYNGSIHVKDIAVDHDYLTSPETIWWWEPRSKNVNRTVIPNAEEIYSIRLNRTTAETPHTKTVPVVCYDMDGHWTRPYFDCFGGHIWMTTFLAPFFNESNQFLWVSIFYHISFLRVCLLLVKINNWFGADLFFFTVAYIYHPLSSVSRCCTGIAVNDSLFVDANDLWICAHQENC